MKDSQKDFLEILEQNQRVIYKVCYLYANNSEILKDLYQEVVPNWLNNPSDLK